MALVALVVSASSARAQDTVELKRMSLRDLMDVEVTAFARMAERTREIPAAVYVITQDDIRRSGATSLPEVLRLAPGVQVSRLDGSRYAIGIRGFPDRLSRAILVLIDGRAVYSPLFAGTYWEVQDTLLEDIERIEVIRGPGGTLWGANAVNGIINIITKAARETQGVLVSAAAGSQMAGPLAFRIGGQANSLHWRGYAKGIELEPQPRADGADSDQWRMAQAGFRTDWVLARQRTLTVQGAVYMARQGQRFALTLFAPPYSQTIERRSALGGGNVVARWAGVVGAGDFQLQAYYDRTTRDERPVAETRNTFDVYFQHRPNPSARHDLVWGVGSRITTDRLATVGPTAFTPPSRTDGLHSAFAQDEFVVVPNRVRFIVGARVDHNAYSGFEIQPSARVMWNVGGGGSVIASVARAVRTPSRVETDYSTNSLSNPAQPAFVRLVPNPGFRPEKVVAYEAGYRLQAADRAYLTFAGFFNDLSDVLSTELLTPFVESTPLPARLILPVTFANGLHGNSHGAEMTADWRTTSWLRTTGSYSYARLQLTRDPTSRDLTQERRGEGATPHHQGQLQVSVDLPRAWQLDWMWRYLSELPAVRVPAYHTSTVRVSWQLPRGVELAIVGQNLDQARHLEWPSGAVGGNVEVSRSVYLGMTWRK